MKRFCAFIAVLLLIISAGCKKEENLPKESVSPPSVYSANLDISFKETKMSAKLTKHSLQKYEVQMLSPEIMTPLNLIYENGICTVKYDGLSFETDLKRFPQSEFGALLIQALNDVDNGITTKNISENGLITYKGITDYGDFTLIQNAGTGLWEEFLINGATLNIVFSDYIIN